MNSVKPNGLVTPRQICVEAIQRETSLPESARSAAESITSVKSARFDDSYMDFLKEQINFGARGPEWTERLERRRDGLACLVGIEHLQCRLQFEGHDWSFHIHDGEVVFREFYSV